MVENEEINNLYRQYLEDALNDPEIVRRKKTFLREWSAASWQPIPMFGVPAIAILSVFLVFQSLQFMPVKTVSVSKPQTAQIPVNVKTEVSQATEKMAEPIAVRRGGTPVRVKKVTSKVGSTMIYQNRDPNVPITVVWVFVR